MLDDADGRFEGGGRKAPARPTVYLVRLFGVFVLPSRGRGWGPRKWTTRSLGAYPDKPLLNLDYPARGRDHRAFIRKTWLPSRLPQSTRSSPKAVVVAARVKGIQDGWPDSPWNHDAPQV